jgi:hypothetical protein
MRFATVDPGRQPGTRIGGRRIVGYQARAGEQPVEPGHAEDEAGQVPLPQVMADTDVPAPDGADAPPDIVTEDDSAGMSGGSSGSSSGGAGTPGHPDAAR